MAPATKGTWDAAADRQLLLAIIQTTNPTPSWPVVGKMIGKTSESARQHYAKLKKENAFPNDGTDETNDAATAGANNSDADSNSDPMLASNIKPLQTQTAKRKRAPKDANKAPPAKRSKKNTTTAAAAADAQGEDSEDAKPRPRASRARRGATATKKTNDDEDMMGSENDNEIDTEGGGIKIKEEEDAAAADDDADAPAPVLKKEIKTRAARVKKVTVTKEAKPRASRAKKTTVAVQADSDDEPDAQVAEEDGTSWPRFASSRTRGFHGTERTVYFDKQKMIEMEAEQKIAEMDTEQQQQQQQQEPEVLENINVGFEADGEEYV